jgi:transposase
MEPVIPPRKHRRIQRSYDKTLYKARHLVENAFLYLKQWRGIATRYAKNTHHSLRLFTSGASFCGRQSRDYTP